MFTLMRNLAFIFNTAFGVRVNTAFGMAFGVHFNAEFGVRFNTAFGRSLPYGAEAFRRVTGNENPPAC